MKSITQSAKGGPEKYCRLGNNADSNITGG